MKGAGRATRVVYMTYDAGAEKIIMCREEYFLVLSLWERKVDILEGGI